jgi:hypothetical protein
MESKRILAQLEALRRSLADADGSERGSFSRVFHAFFDIADDPGLMEASKAFQSEDIRAMLERAAQRLRGQGTTTVTNLRALRCAGAGMVHGGFFAGTLLGTFFYFEREEQGLVAFNDGTPLTNFLRITLAKVPEGSFPVPGPDGVQ